MEDRAHRVGRHVSLAPRCDARFPRGALPQHGDVDPSLGGFYVWVRLPEWSDTTAMLNAAVERRVAYVPGTAFYPDARGADRMRLAFCYPTEDRIREGIARLATLLEDDARLYRSLRGS
jgi:DNA-binding transcriptional MocR family regulator